MKRKRESPSFCITFTPKKRGVDERRGKGEIPAAGFSTRPRKKKKKKGEEER